MTGPKIVPIRPRPPGAQSSASSPYSVFHHEMRELRRKLVNDALDAAGGNRTHAAKALGLQRTYLMRLMREMNAYGTKEPTDPMALKSMSTEYHKARVRR